MKLKSVAILGAGAVGCYLLWGLSKKHDIDLCVIAEGERKKRYEQNGFRINHEEYRPVILTPEEARGIDLLIICTKYQALRPALPQISKIADTHTIVMSLMNGVDSEKIIAEVIPENQIIYSLIKVASERKGNTVLFDPEATIGIVYGEKNLALGKGRTDALDELFQGCGLHYRSSNVIESEIWSKFRLNISNNQAQAMLGVGVGAYEDSEHVHFLQQKLREELDAIAAAKEIDYSLSDSSSGAGSKVPKRARYSTLQDLDAGRHTEVDMFAGTIVRMGKELGIPTPYNEFTYHMIKALEEKNDGWFDYD